MKMIKPLLLMSTLLLVIMLSGCIGDLDGKSISIPTKEEIFGGDIAPAVNAEFYIHLEGTSFFIGMQPLNEDRFPVPANGTLRIVIVAEDGNVNLFDKSYDLTYDDFMIREGRGYMQYEVKIRKDELVKSNSPFGLLSATFATDGNVITSDEYHFEVPHYTYEEVIAKCEVEYLTNAREQNVGKEVGDLILIVKRTGYYDCSFYEMGPKESGDIFRVDIELKNDGNDNIEFHMWNTALIFDSKQYDEHYYDDLGSGIIYEDASKDVSVMFRNVPDDMRGRSIKLILGSACEWEETEWGDKICEEETFDFKITA